MKEQRDLRRRRSLKGGRIVFNNGSSTIDCIIKNLSEGGARVQVENSMGIPTQFMLFLDDGGPAKSCVVKWRTTTALGVAFA